MGKVNEMRLTDDHGQTTRRFPTGRAVTDDGRLVYVPYQLGENVGHEFFLDDTNLGHISLDEAMEKYKERLDGRRNGL